MVGTVVKMRPRGRHARAVACPLGALAGQPLAAGVCGYVVGQRHADVLSVPQRHGGAQLAQALGLDATGHVDPFLAAVRRHNQRAILIDAGVVRRARSPHRRPAGTRAGPRPSILGLPFMHSDPGPPLPLEVLAVQMFCGERHDLGVLLGTRNACQRAPGRAALAHLAVREGVLVLRHHEAFRPHRRPADRAAPRRPREGKGQPSEAARDPH